MTPELKMLALTAVFTAAVWLPYILAHILNVGLLPVLTYTADGTPMPAWAERAKKAHYNAIEGLAPFAALVLVAHAAGISNGATQTAAMAYFWLRVAHYFVYMAGIPFARTLTFAGAWAAQLCIAYQILAV
ncbi:MAG: MAPEG family protein [Rhodospirillaceae bacterium]